ncbi:MAG: TIGR02452 family protein [Myxococcales bacterium]
MKRTHRATVAQQTLDIIQQGTYQAPDGSLVDLRAELTRCIDGSRLYSAEQLEALVREQSSTPTTGPTKLEVTEETSVAAIRRLVVERSLDTLCLNFASAKNAGGGFLGGAEAQEESLARASGLYGSLVSQRGYYDANRASRTAFYTEHMIYSPGVPIFRDDDGALLPRPHLAAFITAPAVNAGVVREREPERAAEIAAVMRRRVARVLGLALGSGHRALVLGAWGCGVFRNDPTLIAGLFAEALETSFKDRFEHVVFAVFDRSQGQPCLRAFRERLAAHV